MYLKNKNRILYILFFLDNDIGIIKNNPIVKNTIEKSLNGVSEKSIKKINSIGSPIYKSFSSIYLPSVLFIFFIVIYN